VDYHEVARYFTDMLASMLLAIGAIGLLAMTWLFPILAAVFAKRSRELASHSHESPRIAILIPAHNEEANLKRTLGSVLSAIRTRSEFHPELEISICVGADGCTDQSAEVARAMGANVVVFEKQQGKWKTITSLVKLAKGFDWVILADAGIV